MDLIAYFEEFLARRPDDRFARYSLALELRKAGRDDDAAAAFAELLARHPRSGAGHFQLGLLWQDPETWFKQGSAAGNPTDALTAEAIDTLIAERNAAKKAKDFARADAVRAELLAQGIVLEDSREGTRWSRA